MHAFVNASQMPLQVFVHDSSPVWVASPFTERNFHPPTDSPVYPGALIKSDALHLFHHNAIQNRASNFLKACVHNKP